MRFLKVVSAVLGIVFVLAGIALVTSGGFLFGVYGNERDSSGFFTTPSQQVGSYGFALTVPDINGQLGPRWERWVPTHARATVRIAGTSELPAPLFIGVGPTSQVSRYLSGVTRDRIQSIDLTAGSIQYDHVDGRSLPATPGKQGFWVAKAEGTGKQTLEWDLEEGDWAVVIMNGDATPPVAATMTIGAHFGIITPLVTGLTAGGFLVLAIGATLVVLGIRRRRPAPTDYRSYGPAVIHTPAPQQTAEEYPPSYPAEEFPPLQPVPPGPPGVPAPPPVPGRGSWRPSEPSGRWDL